MVMKEELKSPVVFTLAYGSFTTWIKQYQYVCACLTLSSITLLTLLTFSMKLEGSKISSHFYSAVI